MLGKQERNVSLFQCVTMEQLVPPKHVLRRLHAALDLSFVRQKVAAVYAAVGRHSVDPEVVVRIWILQHYYGYSEREICDEVTMHAGFRWFCGLSFNDPVPDQSTLVKLRNRKWAKTGLWQALLEETVRACEAAGLSHPGAEQRLGIDGTQITAHAATASLEALPASEPTPAPEPGADAEPDVAAASPAHAGLPAPSVPSTPLASAAAAPGSEPRRSGDPEWHGERFSNATHRSTTDPEARLYRKSAGQEARLRYLGHYLADVRSGVIYGALATAACGTAEREAALTLLDGLTKRPSALAADLGYRDGKFLAALLARGIQPLVPLGKEALEAVPQYRRRTYNLIHFQQRKAAEAEAEARNATRVAARTRAGKQAQRQRTRLEHLFGEAKEHQGLGRAHGRGLVRVDQQIKLTATVQNLKRLLQRRPRSVGAIQAADAAPAGTKNFLRWVEGGRPEGLQPRKYVLSGSDSGLRKPTERRFCAPGAQESADRTFHAGKARTSHNGARRGRRSRISRSSSRF
jgi:IS5 family transposase